MSSSQTEADESEWVREIEWAKNVECKEEQNSEVDVDVWAS